MTAGPPSEGPFVLVATAVAKGKTESDKIAELLQRIARHANSDAEPGTKTYRVTRSLDDGQTFIIFEEYESEAAFEAHRATEEFQSLLPFVPELTTEFKFKFLTEMAL